MRFLRVFLFYVTIFNLTAQNSYEIDSLINDISIAKKDTNMVEMYLKIGDQYRYNEIDSAVKYYKKSLNISEKIEANKLTAKSLINIGVCYDTQGRSKQALEFYFKSLTLYKKLKDNIGLVKCYNNIGVAFYHQGQLEKALTYCMKSLEIYEGLNDKKGVLNCYCNIGDMYNTLGNYDKAEESFQIALKLYKEVGGEKGISNPYTNLGIVSYFQNDQDKALEYFLKALEMYKELGDRNGMSKSYINIGIIYKDKGRYDKSYELYKKALNIKRKFGNIYGEALTLINISELYVKQKKYSKALESANKSLKISKKINASLLQRDCYEVLYIANDSLKNYKSAYKYFKTYKQFNDSIYNEKSVEQINDILARYDSDKKEKENELLKKENKIQTLELEKQTTLRNFFIILSALVILLAVFTYIRYNTKRKANLKLAEKNDLIITQKEQLKKANATKDKFLKIIHHDLLNPFTVIHSTAELLNRFYDNINEQKRREYIKLMLTGSNKFLNLMNNLFEWVKSHTGELVFKPESISLLDVISEELQVQEIFADKKEITITVDVPNTINVFADRNMLRTVFRNLVSNAIKFTHNNGNIGIKSRQLNEFIEIEITDTGVGIDSKDAEKIFDVNSTLSSKGTNDEKGTGFGLALCKEFIEINKGKILVKSELGAGCTILFTLPSV